VWRLIEQCRREIAAGWEQIDAARELLNRTRWLLDRWAAQRLASQPTVYKTHSFDELGGIFVPVKPVKPPRRRRRRKAFLPTPITRASDSKFA
jgi:hypothetical protein